MISIDLKNVSKKYQVNGSKPTLIEKLMLKNPKRYFWAIKNISFSLKRGDRLGLIGPNGSGKTTLLKLISDITFPSGGRISIHGRVISIIELEAGFHLDLTGHENIALNGLIIGMTKKEIKEKMEEIIAFAGIGKFIDRPLYTYSSGMKLRLGFAIAANCSPDILILDENLSVGDSEFRKKSYAKIKSFAKGGTIVIIATHSLTILRQLCNKALWLEKGHMITFGDVGDVLAEFWRRYRK